VTGVKNRLCIAHNPRRKQLASHHFTENLGLEMAALSTSSQSQIASLNYRGAISLASGNDRGAQRSFKGVLAAISALTILPAMSDGNDHTLHPMLVSSLPLSDVRDERFFVYGEVLVFQWTEDALVPSLADLCLCSALTLFNTALVYQRRAMCTGMGSRPLHLTASKVYEHALAVANGLPEDDPNVSSLKVLIRNNLAHIYYYELDAFDTSLYHLEGIKASIATANGGLLAMESNTRGEIVLNLLLTKAPLTARCA
jgi:hypothetical protein